MAETTPVPGDILKVVAEVVRPPGEVSSRVKHSGPTADFCVLCLSGEHERVPGYDDNATKESAGWT